MYYYSYNASNCELISTIESDNVDALSVHSNEFFDLDVTTVVVGSISEDREIKRRTVIPKHPYELIRVIKSVKEFNESNSDRISDIELLMAELLGGATV